MSIQIAAFEFALSVVIEMSFRDVAVAESINAFFLRKLPARMEMYPSKISLLS